MFLFLAILVFLLMHGAVVFWFAQNTPGLALTALTKLLPLILTVLYIALFILAKKIHSWPLETFLLTYLGILFLGFCIVCIFVLLAIILKFLHLALPLNLGFLALGILVFLTLISLFTAAKTPTVKNINIASPGIRGEVKIAFVADTHFGATVGIKRAESLNKILQQIKPDLIVFSGDIFETDSKDSAPFAEILARILPGKKFGVFGNHEYYQGLQNARQSFKKAGINLLENESTLFNNINIIGVNDIKTARISKQNFENILKENVKPNTFNLLLTHTPLHFDTAAQNGINLMLSGHTHRGQIWPFNFLVRLTTPYVYGHFKTGNSDLIVTSGTFFWGPPMRLFTNNEITLITLKGVK